MRKRRVLSTAESSRPWDRERAIRRGTLRILILVDGKAGHQLAAVILQLRLELSAGRSDGDSALKAQPGGGFSGLGSSPVSLIRSRRSSGFRRGVADNSAWVYG